MQGFWIDIGCALMKNKNVYFIPIDSQTCIIIQQKQYL